MSNNLKTLEDLANVFSRTSDSECYVMLRNVIEPAVILLNSKRVKQNLDNDDLIIKLNEHGIKLSKVTLDQKASLKVEDNELYNRMVLVQKSRDFLKHKDIAYIRTAFDEMTNEYNKSIAFNIVRDVAQELKKDAKIQKCSFDFERGMLIFKTPEMLETLLRIRKNKHACNILVHFCERLTGRKSIPFALTYFEEQANANDISFRTIFCEVSSLKISGVKSN